MNIKELDLLTKNTPYYSSRTLEIRTASMFVPKDDTDEALEELERLQREIEADTVTYIKIKERVMAASESPAIPQNQAPFIDMLVNRAVKNVDRLARDLAYVKRKITDIKIKRDTPLKKKKNDSFFDTLCVAACGLLLLGWFWGGD